MYDQQGITNWVDNFKYSALRIDSFALRSFNGDQKLIPHLKTESFIYHIFNYENLSCIVTTKTA